MKNGISNSAIIMATKEIIEAIHDDKGMIVNMVAGKEIIGLPENKREFRTTRGVMLKSKKNGSKVIVTVEMIVRAEKREG
ncbi:MAG: hypothetical protein WC449_06245 [Candidatus Paceibacterota bacterium]